MKRATKPPPAKPTWYGLWHRREQRWMTDSNGKPLRWGKKEGACGALGTLVAFGSISRWEVKPLEDE